MIFVKCKNVGELKNQCQQEYDQYVSLGGKDFYFRSNIDELVEDSNFEQIIQKLVKDHREDADICMQVYTDTREISMPKADILQELQETEDYLRQLPGENYWWMKMKEGKEKYFGLLFWVQYAAKDGESPGLLYLAVHQ